MRVALGKMILVTGLGSLLGCAFCSGAKHQAPAGPVTAAPAEGTPTAKPQEQAPLPPARQSILGAWKLNRDESDDPRKRMQESRSSNGGGYGGRRPGGGWPGGGGGYGGRRGGYGGESDEERQKMHELLRPPSTMTFSMTDGRKLKKSKDDNYQEIAAKWDNNRLTTEEKNPRGGKMRRTFELSPDGRQLYETLNLKLGRDNYETSIRYVYDISSAALSQ